MSEIGYYTVARWIADEFQNSSYVSLRSAIEIALQKHTGLSEEQIFEYSERYEDKVFLSLEKISVNLISDGVEPPFVLTGEPRTAYIKASEISGIPVLEKLRSIDPTAFEEVCANILRSLGANTRRVGKTGDGGVDFVATDLPVTGFDLPALKISRPIVIGQAKRYNDNKFVSVNEVRDFVGGGMVRQDDIKRELYGLFTPVIFAYWTTSDFTKDAYEYCRRAGLWGLSGLSLAQLVIRLNINLDDL